MSLAVKIGGLVVLLVLGVAVFARLAPSDPAVWHVDPARVTKRGARNSYLLGPGGNAPAIHVALAREAAAARLDAIALATPRTTRLAGQGGWATYVTRSALFGFPDYTSVRISPAADGGSEIAIFARARFGDGDLGVNKARVQAWVARLAA